MNLNNKSIILIAPGGSLKDSNLGNKIDKFDVIIRVNNSVTKGYEIDVGSRTDISSSLDAHWLPVSISKESKGRILDDKVHNDEQTINYLKGLKEIWLMECSDRGFKNIDSKWLDKSYTPLIHSFASSKYYTNEYNAPTTGINMLYYLVNTVDKIYVAGFDMYGRWNPKGKDMDYWHYYDVKKKKIPQPDTGFHHDFDNQFKYLMELKKQGRVIFLDKDCDIQKSQSKQKLYTCNDCGKTYYKYRLSINCPYCYNKIDGDYINVI